MTPSTTTPERLFTLRTSLGEDALALRSFRGREALSEPFAFELELIATRPDVEVGALLGTALGFSIDADEPRDFHGYVRRFSRATDTASGERRYVVEVVPWLWFLTRSVDCRVFQDRSVPQILEQVFAEHGFADAVKFELRGDHPAREYCVQYAESAANFASRLMEEEGIFYFYEHAPDGHVLVLADDKLAYRRNPVRELVFDADMRHGDRVGAWERGLTYGSARMAGDAFDFMAPRKSHQAGTASLAETVSFEAYEYAGELRDGTPRPEDRARRAMEAHEVELERVLAESVHRGLGPLNRVQLLHHPDPNEAGEHVVIAIEHDALDPSHDTRVGAQAARRPYSNRFEAIPAERVFRPARRAQRPTIAGPQTAVVVGPTDDELHVDAHGRVRVCFHWDRGDAPVGENSCWIRAAQPWAGKGHGFQFLPRVGDEVLVSFLGGDPDHPLVVGSLFNGDAKPLHDLPAHKDHSGIKTHSLGKEHGFNELRFEDRGGKERVFLHSQRRLDVRAGGSTYETTGGSREIRVGSEKGGLNTHVAHDVNAHIVNDRFDLVDGEHHRVVNGADFERSGAGRRTWVSDAYEITASDLLVQTSGQVSSFSTEQVIEGTHEVSLKGGRIHIEAMAEICLKVGLNHIKIDATGIYIEGMPVSLNCGSSPTSGPGAETIGDLPEPKAAFDAYGAYTGKPGSGGGGRRGARTPRTNDPVPTPTHQPKVFVPPKVPDIVIPTVDPDAELAAITAKCEHSGKSGMRTVAQGGQLDVVPKDSVSLVPIGMTSRAVLVDNIEFEAFPNPDKPPADVEWKIAGPGGTERVLAGMETTAPVQAKYEEEIWIPHHDPASFAVEATATDSSDAPLALTVRAFPAPVEIQKPNLDLIDMLTEPLSTAGDLVWAWTGLVDFELNPGKHWIEAGWQESSGPKAFFGYDIGAEFLPVMKFNGKVPIGPPLGKVVLLIKRALRSAKVLAGDHLKRFEDVLDRMIDLGANALLESNVKLDFRLERNSPSQPLYVDAEANHVDNRAGLSGTNWHGLRTLLPIPAPPPLNMITPTLGNTLMEAWIGLSFSAEPFIDDKGYGLKDYGAAFEGLYLFGQYIDPTMTHTLDILGTQDDPYPLIGHSEDKLFEIGKHYLGEWKDLKPKPSA